GETSFDVDDLTRLDELGRGMVSVIRLTDIQDKPKLFSTFMLQLLAEVYATFPEEGDLDRPKLAIFIDEAHLVFEEATDALLDQLEAIIKLIRSKGVGLFFVTQNPADIPSDILGQLGLKVQHALRAFTAKDRKAIKLASENYPLTDFYDVDTVLTKLGTGEALVTALDRKGRPTPLVRTMLRAPESRMDVLTASEIKNLVSHSPLVRKYNKEVDRESAYEILEKKMEAAAKEEHRAEMEKQREKARKTSSRSRRREKSAFEQILNSTTTRQIGRTVAREFTRGLLGVLGIKRR
ncbi:MAG: helicase HerA-like domain-containing protein, partial [Bacteroidota bacterium]